MKKLKQKCRLGIIPILSGCFTFLGFGTAELYLSNKEEFWFSYGEMLPILLVTGFLTSCICFAVLLLIPNKFFKYGIAVLYGIAVALYIQGNFLPNDYGQLDGAAIDWGRYQGRFLINTLIWIIFIFGSVLLVWKFKSKFIYCCKVVCGIIFATQVITLFTMRLTLPEGRSDDSVLSVQGEFEISTKSNTFVFILDAFDAGLFSELLEKYPERTKGSFNDFTFYSDTVGGATRTKFAIPYILSGQAKTGDGSYVDYLTQSMKNSELFKELSKDKYDARFYTESAYIDMNRTDVIDNAVDMQPKPTSSLGLTRDFIKLTAFRYAPHAMKQFFWLYSGDFDNWKGVQGVMPYTFNDIAFYDRMQSEGVRGSTDKVVFRLYHLMGAHAPYTMDENCKNAEADLGNEESQALGALKIVNDFIAQLKDIGAYNNSTIFIIADHGLRGIDQNPLFMVKQRDLQHEFRESDVPLSFKNIPSMIVDALTQGNIDIDNEYNCQGERYFYYSNEDSEIIEYVINGVAYDVDNFKVTGNIYSGYEEQVSYEYQIGTTLSFAKEATANGYCMSGFSVNEGILTWTLGNVAEMYFKINGKYNNLLLEFQCDVYGSSQNIKVYANENIVADMTVINGDNPKIFIPSEYIKDGGILELKFEIPEARSPKEDGKSDDSRQLGLAMKSIGFYSTDEEK